jgi:hypothetical protein
MQQITRAERQEEDGQDPVSTGSMHRRSGLALGRRIFGTV